MIRALPIVVGYCPGSHAQEALSWAVRESGHLGLPLVVLFAADYPGMATAPGPGMPALDPGALDAAHEVTARGVLDAQQRDRRITVHGRTLVTSATRSLIEASPQASMIVVGSRGRGPVLGAMLGSVSRSVPARAHCPVVVVPPGTAAKVVGPECRVTVGTDGSRVSMLAVDHAAAHRRQPIGTPRRDLLHGRCVTDPAHQRSGARNPVPGGAGHEPEPPGSAADDPHGAQLAAGRADRGLRGIRTSRRRVTGPRSTRAGDPGVGVGLGHPRRKQPGRGGRGTAPRHAPLVASTKVPGWAAGHLAMCPISPRLGRA